MDCVHNYTEKETEKSSFCDDDKFIYSEDSLNTIKNIINILDNEKDINIKIDYLKNINKNKNRFCILSEEKNG